MKKMAIPYENLKQNRYGKPVYESHDDRDIKLGTIMASIILGFVGMVSIGYWSWDSVITKGAVQGQILAKSEMTQTEIKALHIIKPIGERK